jgi:hypothetical protein
VADDGAQPAVLVVGAAERCGEDVAEEGVLVAQGLLVLLGQGGKVTVEAGQHVGVGPVEPVQVGQAGPQPDGRIADAGPGAGSGSCCRAIQCAEHTANSAASSGSAGRRSAGSPGPVRDGGDGGRGRADAAVQLGGGFHDAPARLVYLLGPAAHPVRRPGPWP